MSESIRVPAVWSLPWHTLRLAGRCVLPLVMWYSAGQLVRFGLLAGASELSNGSMRDLRPALTTLLFVVMVMVGLIVCAASCASASTASSSSPRVATG